MTPTTPPEHSLGITSAQRRAAIDALGLDPDLTVTLSVASDWATVVVVQTTESGAPRVIDGAAVTDTLSGPILKPEPTEDEGGA